MWFDPVMMFWLMSFSPRAIQALSPCKGHPSRSVRPIILLGRFICIPSQGDALDFDFGVVAEVDDESKAMPGGFEIVVHLGLMLRRDFFYRLEFENDCAVTDDIRFVGLLH